eukprot:Gb_14430 [translate_table: standard]
MQKLQDLSDGLDGTYRLLYCASEGDKDGLIQELNNGVPSNFADYDKRTALHLAACEGRTEIVKILLEHEADVNCTDRWGRTVRGDEMLADIRDPMDWMDLTKCAMKSLGKIVRNINMYTQEMVQLRNITAYNEELEIRPITMAWWILSQALWHKTNAET